MSVQPGEAETKEEEGEGTVKEGACLLRSLRSYPMLPALIPRKQIKSSLS